jgi:hypothetical protein
MKNLMTMEDSIQDGNQEEQPKFRMETLKIWMISLKWLNLVDKRAHPLKE